MDKNFDILAYLMGKQTGGGGGGDVTVESKSISSNGTYTAPTGKAYSPVTVSVPNSYAAGDEGKVVSNGALVSQTAHEEVTSNGTIDTTLNNSVVVNVSGGGGLEYETGTWTPASDVSRGEVLFANTHTDAPALIALGEYATASTDVTPYTNQTFIYEDMLKLFGGGVHSGNTENALRYSFIQFGRCINNQINIYSVATENGSDSAGDSDTTYARYWAKEDRFYPYANSTSYYWRAGITYKWIAIWAPST